MSTINAQARSSSSTGRVSSPKTCRSCEVKDKAIENLQGKLEQVESSFRSVVAAVKKNQSQLKDKDRIINELIAANSSSRSSGNDISKSDDYKRISELEASICELSTICGEYKSQRAKDKGIIDALNERIKNLCTDDGEKSGSDVVNGEKNVHLMASDKNTLTSSSLKLVRNRSTQTDEISVLPPSHDTFSHQSKRVTVDASTQFSPSFHQELSASDTLTSASVTNCTSSNVHSSKEEVNCHHSALNKSKKVTETAIVIPTRNVDIHSQRRGEEVTTSSISCINVNVNEAQVTHETSSMSVGINCQVKDTSSSNLNACNTSGVSYSHPSASHDRVSEDGDDSGTGGKLKYRYTNETRSEYVKSSHVPSSAQLTIGIPVASDTAASSTTNRPFASSLLASASSTCSSVHRTPVSSAASTYQHHQAPIESVDCSYTQQQQQQQPQKQQQQHISSTLGASSGVSLFYVNELARKEIELAEARLAAREYECALRELQWQSSVEKFRLKAKVTEYEKVRAQLTQLTAASTSINQITSPVNCDASGNTVNHTTAFNANLLYVKNVLLNYIKTTDKKQQKIILNALLTALDMEERV